MSDTAGFHQISRLCKMERQLKDLSSTLKNHPGAVEEMDKIVKELSAIGIIREDLNPITNSPNQAIKKPESAGGGLRPVINFKALNRRTIANRASLINPQGALKTQSQEI
ncbi:hypothetical protein AMECASPLE_012992 [Ameca splendens]|uniref:Uncharacterized protein n=1 Tax=Ameca splendens TaxID=208324 RepID=A0ABV1AA52_9TELE